jgi:hypothetical protein
VGQEWSGGLATTTWCWICAVREPLQDAVWPVKIVVVEHPSLSVTTSVAVFPPAAA